ncbi:MAG: hypothetical protein PHC68_17645 [Syntrophorhabdaceae bacterium]|nr:hypothetical protein [Syntrophorhabdaceae bacterium]
MTGLFEVTTNQGRLTFPVCCPGCGNRDWDEIGGWPEWRKCHSCDVQIKQETSKNGFLRLTVLTEDQKQIREKRGE